MTQDRPIAGADAITQPWWDATRESRLLVQRCDDCGAHQHYPRALCTACRSGRLSYVESAGRGEVHSFTVVHRSPHPAFEPPYVVALVRLEEGPVMLSNIVGGPPDGISCGMRVQVTWEELADGRRLPLFTPGG